MTNNPGNDDPNAPRDPSGGHDPEPAAPSEAQVHRVAGGCLSAFVMLWGFAFLMVGLLITAVSGYCGAIIIGAGGGGARELGGTVMVGFVIGVLLCVGGYFMMRRGLDR